jgi:hypothetical protein
LGFGGGAMKKRKIYTFKDAGPLSRVAINALYVDLGFHGLGVAANFIALRDVLGQDLLLPKDTPLASDLLAALSALILLVVMIVVGVIVLKWIYRVNRNVHAVAPGLPVSPPWSVGWYFIPVFSLWKPFEAMKSVWQVSSNPENRRSVLIPSIMRWWWGLFLVTSFASNISFRLVTMGDTLGSQAGALTCDLLAGVLAIPLDLVFIRLVREVTARQSDNLPIAAEKRRADFEADSGAALA